MLTKKVLEIGDVLDGFVYIIAAGHELVLLGDIRIGKAALQCGCAFYGKINGSAARKDCRQVVGKGVCRLIQNFLSSKDKCFAFIMNILSPMDTIGIG